MAGIVVINISLEGDNEVSEIYKLHRQTRWVDLEAMVRGNERELHLQLNR